MCSACFKPKNVFDTQSHLFLIGLFMSLWNLIHLSHSENQNKAKATTAALFGFKFGLAIEKTQRKKSVRAPRKKKIHGVNHRCSHHHHQHATTNTPTSSMPQPLLSLHHVDFHYFDLSVLGHHKIPTPQFKKCIGPPTTAFHFAQQGWCNVLKGGRDNTCGRKRWKGTEKRISTRLVHSFNHDPPHDYSRLIWSLNWCLDRTTSLLLCHK